MHALVALTARASGASQGHATPPARAAGLGKLSPESRPWHRRLLLIICIWLSRAYMYARVRIL